MKERPILFSAPMVRAILEGRKTQTRRAVKPQPIGKTSRRFIVSDDSPKAWHDCDDFAALCPYGQPGDRLWVRETFGQISLAHSDGITEADVLHFEGEDGNDYCVLYRATAPRGFVWNGEPESRWTPSIHMPRWASRITLDVVSVRVERLQDISETDAQAEGVERMRLWTSEDYDEHDKGQGYTPPMSSYAGAFEHLWNDIHGKRAPMALWSDNPWVWVVEFKRC